MKSRLAITQDKHFKEVGSISDDDAAILRAYVKDLYTYSKLQKLYRMVVANFGDYYKLITRLANVPSAELDLGRKYLDEVNFEADRLLINYFTVFRSYSDHSERILKKYFGATSEEYGKYDTETSRVYDSSFGYRLIYKLRNYTQHCEMPVGHLNFVTDRTVKPEEMIGAFQLILDRDQLLKDYNGWGSTKKDIELQNERFDLHSLVKDSISGIRHIDNVVDELFKPKILQIESAIERHFPVVDYDRYGYCIFSEAKDTGPTIDVSLQYIPVECLAFKNKKSDFFKS